ncbi:F-box protein [Endozoicomonas sp. ONNA2]|uniref:F-box protein n=1 Tax=Endozoicomonas sp. ONNA2 TaxID=2828741 RepID=UPI00214807A8|nr:F-box protein [Endozoicomonas sp. ONNA2]
MITSITTLKNLFFKPSAQDCQNPSNKPEFSNWEVSECDIGNDDRLSRLPIEIKHHIASNLSFKNLLAFRITNKITCSQIDEAFLFDAKTREQNRPPIEPLMASGGNIESMPLKSPRDDNWRYLSCSEAEFATSLYEFSRDTSFSYLFRKEISLMAINLFNSDTLHGTSAEIMLELAKTIYDPRIGLSNKIDKLQQLAELIQSRSANMGYRILFEKSASIDSMINNKQHSLVNDTLWQTLFSPEGRQ